MKIGLLVGLEESFPRGLIDRLRDAEIDGLEVEMISTGGVRHDDPGDHDVVLDRISPRVRFYRGWVKHTALRGTRVVNDPFALAVDDRFLHFSVARNLGIAVPRTVLLPQKTCPGAVGDAALRNLQYPLPWEQHLEWVGLPACLRAVDPAGWRHRARIDSLEELWYRYDETGEHAMLLQEFVDHDRFVRALVVGDRVILARYDPEYHHYLLDPDYLDAELEERVVRDARRLTRALGYVINAVDFGIRDGAPVLIDALNPVPDFEVETLTPYFFEHVLDSVADLLVATAREGRAPERALDAGDDDAPLRAFIGGLATVAPPGARRRRAGKKVAKRTRKSDRKAATRTVDAAKKKPATKKPANKKPANKKPAKKKPARDQKTTRKPGKTTTARPTGRSRGAGA